MEAVERMSIKEVYMSKSRFIPDTVNKLQIKTTLAGTYEPELQKGYWEQENEEGKGNIGG